MIFDLRREIKQNLAIALVAFLSTVLIFEVVGRLLISPSQYSYGALFGVELPPFELIPATTPPGNVDRSAWYEDLVVDGQRITVGDLWGFSRKDLLLGYAPQENVVSLNGWWQSNNLGARARYEISRSRPPGQRRLLVFGDSFAVGSRLPYEEVWSTILDSESESLEVVNFGVDGYGMGQSFLRYRQMRNTVDHDIVLLMFTPSQDLWRDINTRRDLLAGDWKLYWVMPRFIIEDGQLKLISSPFKSEASNSDKNLDLINEALRTHLRLYDRYYFRLKYEEPWLLGKSLLFKLLARSYYEYQRQRLNSSLLSTDSEALQVSKKVFEAMEDEVKQDGNEFVLVFLPGHQDLKLLQQDNAYRNDWDKMISSVCHPNMACINLSQNLAQLSASELDRGYDGTHYGPKVNFVIAAVIRKYLENEDTLSFQVANPGEHRLR